MCNRCSAATARRWTSTQRSVVVMTGTDGQGRHCGFALLSQGRSTVIAMSSIGAGLEVFPLALGGNTFGWASDETASHQVLDAFVEAGGDFLDTADGYSAWAPGNSGGESETIIGDWIASRGFRDRVVIGDYTMVGPRCFITDDPGHPTDPRGSTEPRRVEIGRNAWLGHSALVLPGSTIGDHSVIGAGSV